MGSGDVDLLFVALHQTNLQSLGKRSSMNRGLYFDDQFNRISHLGGIHRYKRHPEELNQALHHVRIAQAADNDSPTKTDTTTPSTSIYPTPSPVKQQLNRQNNDVFLKTIQRKLNAPVIPEVLFKELDTLFQRYDEKTKRAVSSATTKTPSTNARRSAEDTFEETDVMPIQDAEDEDELIAAISNVPKVSLPGSLIVKLHSTWADLIQNTEYKYKTWRTKAAEDSWRRHLERKRLEELNAETKRTLAAGKNRRRTSSRASVISLTKSSLPQMRSNRSLSRVSFVSMSNMSQLDKLRAIQQGSLESLAESVKSGIHVEFKLSTQTEQIKPPGVTFDVPKPVVDVSEDVIALMQTKCKRLLHETKEKIWKSIGDPNHRKMCKIWFYGENQHIRNKSNLLTLNESARKQKSKFVFSILRKEIPEEYSVDIEIPANKHKCYLETIDGSIQIYYPSGRLALLRLPLPNSCTLFFDDTDLSDKQFLGLVTSSGSVLIMQPTSHARFVTDIPHERAYLCDGKTGAIEKQIPCHFNQPTQINEGDEEDILPPLFENTIQLQLNSSMQLEYHNPTNIPFAFAAQREEFKYQLGNSSSIANNDLMMMKRKLTNKLKDSLEKQEIQVERLLDGQVNLKELPMMKELITLRKRIRNLCNSWLKECRITLVRQDIFLME